MEMIDYEEVISKPITSELNDAKRERELMMGDVISERIKFVESIRSNVGEDIKNTLLEANKPPKRGSLIKRILLKIAEKC